jgi:4-amino-4-deoxy-L-arabinose transferase-like glycosyltransferase
LLNKPEGRSEEGAGGSPRLEALLLAAILALSLATGLLYARLLPPWHLIDEEQHFHYIQHLALGQGLPVLGQTFLSPEVIDSIFATNRWAAYGLGAPPPSRDPQDMGLEGYSYEAYQPPLFYLLSLPVYNLLGSGDILTRLFGLRVLVVVIGTATVLMAYLTARILVPGARSVALGSAALLTLIPERAISVSRVNNDALVEALSVAVLLLLLLAMERGFGWRLTLTIGVVLGGALLAKINALILLPTAALALGLAHLSRGLQWRRALGRGLAIYVVAAVMASWFFFRNVQLYGDPTGVEAFLRLASFQPDVSPLAFIWSLFRGFWAMWWEGRLATAFMMVMAAIALIALFGLLRVALREGSKRTGLALLLVFGLLSVLAVWQSARMGLVPIVQGRLLLPAYTSLSILLVWGLVAALPRRLQAYGVAGTLVVVLALHSVYFYFRVLVGFYGL